MLYLDTLSSGDFANGRNAYKDKGFMNKEIFEARSLDLAARFRVVANSFDALPDDLKEFFQIIGYDRVRQLAALTEVGKLSQGQIAIKCDLSKDQVYRIFKERRARNI